MNSTKNTIRGTRLHVLLGAALLGLLVTPLAVAGAAEQPVAGASKVTDAKFKKLKKRIAQLEEAIQTPRGPAGGDLVGQYPNPRIGEDAIGSAEVTENTLGADDLASNSVGSAELATGSVGIDELANDTVGGGALKGLTARVGPGSGSNNNYVNASVTCLPGEMAIGGGYAWTNDADVTMVASAPAEGIDANTTWVVRGKSPTANTLFAWANCIQA